MKCRIAKRRIGTSAALCAAVLFLGGCATQPAWPPTVQRLPEAPAAPGRAAPAPAATVSTAPLAQPVPVTFDEMAQMAREGTPSGVIIQKLRDSRLNYSVNAEEAKALAARGVPAEVIAYLQQGEAGIAPRAAAPAYSAYPPANPYPAYGDPYYAYPSYAYPYTYPYAYPYAAPYRGYYGPRYPGSSLSFGFSFGRRR